MPLEPPNTLLPSKSVEPVVLVPCVDGPPIAPVVEPPELNGAPPSVPGIAPVVELPELNGVAPNVPGIPPLIDEPVFGVAPRVSPMPPVMGPLTPGPGILGLDEPLKARPRACPSAGPATNAWATSIETRKANNHMVFLPKA
ncbi:MAG TPA: hypothetical protein VGL14_15575 [Methylomirabilota bacterium]